MSTRGWEHVTSQDLNRRAVRQAKPSKYRNVKTVIGGVTFDSKREAAYWQVLKAREKAGEISDLKCQHPFQLLCPIVQQPGADAVVALYIADFAYMEDGTFHVVDAKGARTQMYVLKRKWLELQTGIVIEEV